MSTKKDLSIAEFCCEMPKVELHAHINGSISEATMKKLLKKKNREGDKLSFQKDQTATLEDCFHMFKLIHQVSDNTEAAYTITYDVIHEFAAENVKYLELRSTPREVKATGMTKKGYVEAVIKAIQDCNDIDIIVKFILAVDRRNGVDIAKETVELAAKYKTLSNGIVIGVDLSGDPTVGDARRLHSVFEQAKQAGLKLALHLAEVPNIEETLAMLKLPPNRIGHGTCLLPEVGGSEELTDYVYTHKIPLELCLTSNVIGQTVPNFDNHHFLNWYQRNHPCVICTDDKGVFNTTLSEEYQIAAKTFDLSVDNIWKLSFESIEYIFAAEDIKEKLRQKFLQFRQL
ncbi:Adenosine deaminase-like protein A,Adenosine deaminase-like protein [Mytilus edulis]|uniref:Adenosine deaminase-like protein A,Adenosine deaminase-like protein n=1 Tax=Mytilus edulis TaxID=6550 RepID=A0A8S3S5Z0_MYTED|nr:Adenosine deaminase-like protein A,Adenosine deaminase-like protein [Mytilus edulis]